jgi:hypothetical protein
MAAKAKYAGLRGDIGVAPVKNRSWVRRGVFASPARVGAGETLGGEKRLFQGKIREPGGKPHRDMASERQAGSIKKQNNR